MCSFRRAVLDVRISHLTCATVAYRPNITRLGKVKRSDAHVPAVGDDGNNPSIALASMGAQIGDSGTFLT